MKKGLLALLAAIVIAGALLLLSPVRTLLVIATLPDYPDWPAPKQTLTTHSPEASDAVKMTARFTSATRFSDCVGYGFTVGRDGVARDNGYRDIEVFVRNNWQLR